MDTMTRKVCVVCGADVSQTKRTKDTAGRYYCEPCVQKARQRQHAATDGPAPRNNLNGRAPVGSSLTAGPSLSPPPPASGMPPPLPSPRSEQCFQYAINGVDRQTGAEVNFELEAASEKEAVIAAQGRGLLVAGCKRLKRVMPPQAPAGNSSGQPVGEMGTPTSRWNRFLRGGLLGLLDEKFCVSISQTGVIGSNKREKALRLALVAGSTVVLFVMVMLGAIGIGELMSKSRPSESGKDASASAEHRVNEPKGPRRNTYAVGLFMDTWKAGPEFADMAARQLDPRAIDAVKELVRETAVKSFDGKITYIGENTITVYETGTQFQCQAFEVTPVVRLSSELHMPITYRVSVANDSEKVIAIQPSKM